METLTNELLIGYLRNALHYLYDPVHLRRNSLIRTLKLQNEFDPAAVLQQILIASIQALKPSADESPQSTAWKTYDLLNLLYVRQNPRLMVATQLGVSERQLRREQRLALETLARYLRQHYPVFADTPSEPLTPSPPTDELTFNDAFSAEIDWLKNPEFEQRSPLQEALNDVLTLVRPLSNQWRVSMALDVHASVGELPVAHLVIRNILLTILSIIIPQAGQGPVKVTALRAQHEIEIRVSCAYQDDRHVRQPFSDKENISIETARRLAALYGARLVISPSELGIEIVLRLPVPEQFVVLVIDDNADWLDLLKRYAIGSRYQIVGCHEPEVAVAMAEKLQPAVIFLDVMMPNIDGWQLIGELRQERSTSHIPIIVCSILPVEGLALSLGVNAYLQKPITQDQFFSAIKQVLGGSSSHE